MVLCLTAPGCALVELATEAPVRALASMLPGETEADIPDAVDLQEELLRYAYHFIASTTVAAESLQRDGQPIQRHELVRIKLKLATEVLALATGANALGNLVDLAVLASAATARVEDYWLPRIYGQSAMPALRVLQDRERQIWGLVNDILPAVQRAELRAAIAVWRRERATMPGDMEAFASLSLVNEVIHYGKRKQSSGRLPSSVFALLDADPLAGLDPATRELTQTRLFAERALFIGQRMPQLIEWQLELLVARTAENPRVSQVIMSTGQMAEAGSRISRTVEKIPELLGSERERWQDIFSAGQRNLGTLSRDIGHTLEEGVRMAESTDRVLKSYAQIMELAARHPSGQSGPDQIRAYADTAMEINRMAERLTEMLRTLQPNLQPAYLERLSRLTEDMSRQAKEQGKEAVDYAFWRALLFTVACCLMVLATRAGWKYLDRRMS